MKTRFDKTMLYAAYGYIALPYIIFALGWLQWYYGIAISLVVIVSCLLSLGKYTDLREVVLQKHAKKIGLVLLVILAWVFFSGIGEYSYQRGDHLYRNAIFHDLISHDWPVVYKNINWLDAGRETTPPLYILTYYIGFWLPAALAGKLFGWAAGNFVLYMWTALGLSLVFYFICRLFNKFSLKIFWVFLFFSSLYIFGAFARVPVKTVLISDYFLWAGRMVMAGSNTGLLYEVFNQSLVPWLVFLLILNNIPKQNLFFVYIFCFFQGPFAFIGLFPFVVYFSCKDLFIKNDGTSGFFKKLAPLFSFQNIIGGLFVLIPLYLYMGGNSSAQKFTVLHPDKLKYLQVVVLSFGVLAAILFKRYKKEPLFYISLAILFVVPFFQLGYGMDLCGRVSIPPMFLMMILCIKVLVEQNSKMLKTAVVVYLVIAAAEPIGSIGRSIVFTLHHYTHPEATNALLYNRELGYPLWTKNFVYPIPDSVQHKNFLIKDDYGAVDNRNNWEIRNFVGNTEKSRLYKYLAKHE